MRNALSIGVTKTLPSPIWPVRAREVIASITFSAMFESTATSIRNFGRKFTTYSAPR